ncbi:hypothetical protein F5Y12DRAFT_758693 [Xylaria sp. FL1777]|nr:hypothetical protein F5Y12DRAFT_758693 [Xylaria sp. FL1777]
MLTKLPPEVFSIIADMLHKSDLQSLSLVSRRTYELSVRALWKSVTFNPTHAASIGHICFKLTTDLHLLPDEKVKMVRDCDSIHRFDYLFGTEGEPTAEFFNNRWRFDHLAQRLHSVLTRFEDGQLHSFSWHLGICVPSEILGDHGIISLRHNCSLRSLYLETDFMCHFSHNGRYKIDLSPFHQLRSLTWKRPTPCNLETLSVALRTNSRHIQEVDVDFICWEVFEHILDNDDSHRKSDFELHSLFSDTMPGLNNLSPVLYFPDIRILSLIEVPIVVSMIPVLNFNTLVSLTLCNCPGWITFLEHIAGQNFSIHLKRLEIKGLRGDSILGAPVVGRFIRTFQGLEELFIRENYESEDGLHNLELIWDNAAHHHATLKKFVYHPQPLTWQSELQDLAIPPHQLQRMKDDPTQQNPLARLDLECIGLACGLGLLKTILQHFKSKSSLKLLHIRQSIGDTRYSPLRETAEAARFTPSREFLQFLEWVYGPTGLPSLQIVACGDFTFTDPCDSVIVYRDTGEKLNFRILSSKDAIRIRSEFSEVLEACPTT